MIEVRNLKKIYNGNAVLKDVNAVIEKGEVISIIGPSGTGKSTFLIYYTCYTVRKRCMGNSVEYHSTDCNLTDVAFTSSFGRNELCKQFYITLRVFSRGR